MGLIVDLLFPNEDVPIGKVLANISSRGCLYAILVMPVNEENRSLTLNVLHGIPQGKYIISDTHYFSTLFILEHRNMPIEDALILMSRNYEAYMKGEHLPAENTGQMSLLDRHPTPMQVRMHYEIIKHIFDIFIPISIFKICLDGEKRKLVMYLFAFFFCLLW